MANKKIVYGYSVEEAAAALKERGFKPIAASTDKVRIWERGDWQVTFRAGELDVASRGRLERELKKIDQFDERARAEAAAKKQAVRPDGFPKEYDAFQNGNLITLADKQPPYFSLSFAKDSDAVMLGNADMLSQTSAPIKELLKEAAEKFDLQVTRQNGQVRIERPDLGIQTPPLEAESPGYIQDFTKVLAQATKTAEHAKKLRDDLGVRFFTENGTVTIWQTDLGIKTTVAAGVPGYFHAFEKELQKVEEIARIQGGERLEALNQLENVTANGKPVTYELTPVANAAEAGRVLSELQIRPHMQIPYYSDGILPRQIRETITRRIKKHELLERAVRRHAQDSSGLSGEFTSKFAGPQTGAALPGR